jgi:hypothetical protein
MVIVLMLLIPIIAIYFIYYLDKLWWGTRNLPKWIMSVLCVFVIAGVYYLEYFLYQGWF